MIQRHEGFLYQINVCKVNDGVLKVVGWIVDLDQPLDHFSVALNGHPWLVDVPLLERTAVRDRFPRIAHTLVSGIQIEEPVPAGVRGAAFTLGITVTAEGKECGSLMIPLRDFAVADQTVPLPPIELQAHVGQMAPDPEQVLSSGWRFYQDIKRHVEAFRRLGDMGRILDWGCGCGRVLRFLIQDVPADRVYGCDIDAEAIAWDSAHMPGPAYTTIAGHPPTPYADGMFDLVVGISIFTHLDEPTQFEWLSELNRITASGGLVAVSVLGPHSTHPMHRPKIEEAGIFDQPSAQADVFAPYVGADYYRLTYHTRAYIEREWSRYFDLLEYSIFGMSSHQDLIIMRKKSSVAGQPGAGDAQ